MKKILTVIIIAGMIVGVALALDRPESANKNKNGATVSESVKSVLPPDISGPSIAPKSNFKIDDTSKNSYASNNGLEKSIETPEESLVAFNKIERCVNLSEIKRNIVSLSRTQEGINAQDRFDTENSELLKYCESLTARQIADRIALVEKAAIAGVPGAATAYFNAGPNGHPEDFEMRPDDPNIYDWKQKAIGYLRNAAENGDLNSIAQLSYIYSGNGMEALNIPKALGYELALRDAQIAYSNEKAASQPTPFIAYLKSQASEADLAEAQNIRETTVRKCCVNK